MKLSRSLIVLALVTAAAVLIPLRRARAAFAPCAAVAGTTPAPRGSMRRRPSRPSPVPRVQPPAHRQDVSVSTTTATPRVGKARRRGVTDAPARDAARQAAAHCGLSVTKAPGHDAPGGDAGDCVVDAAPRPSRQDQVSSRVPTSRAAAATQAVADVPKPPPKQAAL
jgi:hypothetical protein